MSTSTPIVLGPKRKVWEVGISPESLGPLLVRPGGKDWLIRELTAEQARRSLREFVRQAWHVVEPETPFVDGWVIGAMCEHLQALVEGQIRDLIINIPPRHMKSLLTSVFMPVWRWTTKPGEQFLCSSYGDSLSIRDAVKSRRLIKSSWFQERWGCPYPDHDVPGFEVENCPAKLHLLDDQDAKHYYTNDHGGHRFSTSVDAATTGMGGDVLLLDDPHNIQEAESEVVRERTLEYVDQSWGRRGNNPKTARRVVIMQRVHVADVTAHLLKKGGWVHLCLPAEYKGVAYSYPKNFKPAANPLGWVDPRTEAGELLWPERMGPKEIAQAKIDHGARGYAGQFDQEPTAAGGDMFNIPVLRAHTVPGLTKLPLWTDQLRVNWGRGWDLASTTKKSSKRTAGVKLGIDEHGRYIIAHVRTGKWRPDERNDEMLKTMVADGAIWQKVEKEGGSSGIDQELALTRVFDGHRVEFLKVTGDKKVRADQFAAQCNAGNVWIIDDGTWDVELYLNELQSFPNGDYLDQVDGSSLIYNWIRGQKPERIEPKGPRDRGAPTFASEIDARAPIAIPDDWMSRLRS